jgi:hypothetical protein
MEFRKYVFTELQRYGNTEIRKSVHMELRNYGSTEIVESLEGKQVTWSSCSSDSG